MNAVSEHFEFAGETLFFILQQFHTLIDCGRLNHIGHPSQIEKCPDLFYIEAHPLELLDVVKIRILPSIIKDEP